MKALRYCMYNKIAQNCYLKNLIAFGLRFDDNI